VVNAEIENGFLPVSSVTLKDFVFSFDELGRPEPCEFFVLVFSKPVQLIEGKISGIVLSLKYFGFGTD